MKLRKKQNYRKGRQDYNSCSKRRQQLRSKRIGNIVNRFQTGDRNIIRNCFETYPSSLFKLVRPIAYLHVYLFIVSSSSCFIWCSSRKRWYACINNWFLCLFAFWPLNNPCRCSRRHTTTILIWSLLQHRMCFRVYTYC